MLRDWTSRVISWSIRGARSRRWSAHWASHLVEESFWHLRVPLLAERSLLHTGTAYSSYSRMAWCVCGRRPENRPRILDKAATQRTDHASLVRDKGGDPGNRPCDLWSYGVEKGGDPKTDHASFRCWCCLVDVMAATCLSLVGRGGWQPKLPNSTLSLLD